MVKISANGIDNQIPVTPKNVGRTDILTTTNTNERSIEIMAEILPLQTEVKNPDIKILIPQNKKQNEKSLNPYSAML